MATGATEYHLHRSDIGTREGHDVRGYFQSTASERNPRNLTLLEGPIQSVEFYRRVFGFETIDTDQNEGVTDETRLSAKRAGDRSVLLLFKKGATTDTNATGAIHVAFGISRSELPAWEAWRSQQGITIEQRKTWKYGGEALYFRDPMVICWRWSDPVCGASTDAVPRITVCHFAIALTPRNRRASRRLVGKPYLTE